MSLQVSLATLRTRALLRADMVNTAFRTTTLGGQVDSIINAEYRKAYALVCDADDDWNLSSEDTVTSGASTISLPATMYRLKGVDAYPNGTTGDAVRVPKFRWDERTKYATAGGWTMFGPSSYRLRGSNLVLYPTPPSGITIRIWYVPAPETLDQDADTIDAVTGIDELVVLGTARTLLLEEGDLEAVQVLAAEYAAHLQNVLANVQSRGEVESAADVIRPEFW